MKICILGDTGLLGQACVRQFSKEHDLLGISTTSVPPIPLSVNYAHAFYDVLTASQSFVKTIADAQPQLIINCAALADIGICERDPEKAFHLNALLPEQLAILAKELGAGFIHVSTDAFFSGLSREPHKESDLPSPCNVYGQTKLEGEQRVLLKYPQALVVRTNLVGFRDRANALTFGEWLCHALHQGQEISLADDFIASSIHVDFFVSLMFLAYRRNGTGLLNIASHDSASKYTFGRLLAETLGTDFGRVKRVTIEALNLVPARAPYIALDVTKGELFLGHQFPDIFATIKKLASDFKQRLCPRMTHG